MIAVIGMPITSETMPARTVARGRSARRLRPLASGLLAQAPRRDASASILDPLGQAGGDVLLVFRT